jgi:hypothetical protein
VQLRVRPWGSKAASMTFRVDGRRRAVDRRAPFLFRWNAARAKPGKHLLEVVATSVDGRVAKRRIPLVAAARPVVKPKPALRIAAQALTAAAPGLTVWRVETAGLVAKVEFLVDGTLRGTDVAAPYTFGWSTAGVQPGAHVLTARAVGKSGKVAEASIAGAVP